MNSLIAQLALMVALMGNAQTIAHSTISGVSHVCTRGWSVEMDRPTYRCTTGQFHPLAFRWTLGAQKDLQAAHRAIHRAAWRVGLKASDSAYVAHSRATVIVGLRQSAHSLSQ